MTDQYEGKNVVRASEGDAVLHGTDDDDVLIAARGVSHLYGNDGDDIFVFTEMEDMRSPESYERDLIYVYGGNGHDVIEFRFNPGRYEFSRNPVDNTIVINNLQGERYTIIASDIEALSFPTGNSRYPEHILDTDSIGSDGLAIHGTDGDDVLMAVNGVNYLYGNGGNNIFVSQYREGLWTNSSQQDLIYFVGGDGYDVIEFRYNTHSYAFSRHPVEDYITVTNVHGRVFGIVSPNVERFLFPNNTDRRYENVIDADTIGFTGLTSGHELTRLNNFSVYRFYNTDSDTYVYTSDVPEAYMIQARSGGDPFMWGNPNTWPYVLQGKTFDIAHSYDSPAKVAIHRFYNADSQYHFYSVDPDEIADIKARTEAGELNFNYEGISFDVYLNDPNPEFDGLEVKVHRLYNPGNNTHIYTANEEEVELLQLTGLWNYEGIAFYGEGV